jgi:nucleotide-binding universal stress UspA family protein
MPTFPEVARSRDLVVAYESSPCSDTALEFAVDLAERLDARLHIIHVVTLADLPVDPDLAGSELEGELLRTSLDRDRADAEKIMAAFGGEWTYSNATGNAVRRINAAAGECDALAIILGMSTRGVRGVIHRLLKGSLGREMAKRSDRAVLTVPACPARPASAH